jgi:hypothetical protein
VHDIAKQQQQQQPGEEATAAATALGIASIPAIILRSLDRLSVVLQPGSLGQVVQSKDGLIIRR